MGVLPARSPTAPVTNRPTVAKTEPSRPVTAPQTSSVPAPTSASADLLGLMGSPAPVSAIVPTAAASSVPPSASSDLLAEFGDFTSAVAPAPVAQNQSSSSDLFGAMSQPAPTANADPGKMSTDSIMALFGPAASSSPRFPSVPQASFQAPQPFGQTPGSLQGPPQHLANMQSFGAPVSPQFAAANNPFLAEAGLMGGQPGGLGGQLAGLNLNQGQAPLWQ